MIAEVLLVKNHDEVMQYNQDVEDNSFEELFNLGKYDKPVEVEQTVYPFAFNMADIKLAWVIYNPSKAINIKLHDGEVWSLVYKDELWEEIKVIFE